MTRRIDPDDLSVAAGAEAGSDAPAAGRRAWGTRGTARASFASHVTLEDVSQSFQTVAALKNVTIDIPPAETVCLLGQSGCGKTTLLRIIAGIDAPARGRVLFDGREVSGPSLLVPPEKRGVGLMFQDYALFPHLTILDNVMFGLRDLPRATARAEARAVLSRVGLEDAARFYPHILSGGEQQRVALARAIVPRPGIILMDEPFSGLDSRLRDDVRDETMAILRETRSTSVIVTHDPEEAMRVADRIILLRRGEVIQSGSAEDLYRAPKDLETARFFSEINEIAGKSVDGMLVTPLGRFATDTVPAGSWGVACIRPQSLTFTKPGEAAAGRVLTRRFLGEVDLYEIAVEGLTRPVFARIRGTNLAAGEDVGVAVADDEVMVFPASE